MQSFDGIAMELALRAAGHKFPRLSQVGAAWAEDTGPPSKVDLEPARERPVSIDTDTDGYSIFLLDVTVTDSGRIHLIEANGSNAALSSSILGKDDRRARHMFLAYKSKKKPMGQVTVLLAHQHNLIHIAEFYGRAGIFAELVSETQSTRLCDTSENLGEEEVSIICGAIRDIAPFVEANDRRLFFKRRPVVFASNPNLLPEMVRSGVLVREGDSYNLDVSVYHDGRCTPLVHDKGVQQDIAVGTGITPLYYREANSFDECIEVIESFWDLGLVAVGKMNAGSGGTGIEFFPRSGMQDIVSKLSRLLSTARAKYGENIEKSVYPIRFFEFAQSTFYWLYDKPHLWDLRLQCLVYPGYVEVTPCVIRLCPDPFDRETYAWNGVVSNLSGRDPTLIGRCMRSPAAMRRSREGSVLESIGISREKLMEIVGSCARWSEVAWKMYSKEALSVSRERVTGSSTKV